MRTAVFMLKIGILRGMNEKIHPKSDADAVAAEIGGILAEVSVMGFNDYEIPALQELMRKVSAGEIDPQLALGQARSIRGGKQDYH
jgi:uncharacterized Fe-S cluster-containing radical SAM superfamily enzyme